MRAKYLKYLFSLILRTRILLLLISASSFCQEHTFSQYFTTRQNINPAFTGAERDIFLAVNYRSQWNSIAFPYKISQASVIMPIFSNSPQAIHTGGIGAFFYNESAGENNEFSTYGFNLSAAKNVSPRFSKNHRFSFGVQAGLVQKRLNLNELTWGSQYKTFLGEAPATEITQIRQQTFYPVINAGALWFYSPGSRSGRQRISTFAGASINNINNPDQSFIKNAKNHLPLAYKLNGGAEIPLRYNLSVSPSFLLNLSAQNSFYTIGSLLTYAYLSGAGYRKTENLRVNAGVWYRISDVLTFTAGFMKKGLSVGFGYDANMSKVRYSAKGRGAFEIYLSYRILRNNSIKRFSSPLM